MSIARIIFVHVVIAALVVPSLYDTFAKEEHWPYSRYPMYSGIAPATPGPSYRVYGVTRDDPPAEIRLPERSFVGPLSTLRLQIALTRLAASEHREASMRAVLRNFLERYDVHRLQFARPLPAVRGLRLYFVDPNDSSQGGSPGQLVSEFPDVAEGH
jgi:hypothetical protein